MPVVFGHPNGIGVGPDGQVTCGDNEGTFVPTAPLHWVKPGQFHGVVDAYEHKDKLKTSSSKGVNKSPSTRPGGNPQAPRMDE